MKALVLLSCLLTGCATESRFQAAEATFHALNFIDQAQSINAISKDCYREADPFTSRVLGEKPSSQEFALYGIAISFAFNAINRMDWMQERPKLRATFDAIAIGAKAYTVVNNHQIGMMVAGSNGC